MGCRMTMDFLPLEFIHRPESTAQRVVLFPGTWNPPTIAHLEIARAALHHADEVTWVLPRAFPHKDFAGADFAARASMLQSLMHESPRFSAAISTGGLYADIAREARASLGDQADIALVLGRDAAHRIATWDYGRPAFFDDFIRDFRLLVAARHGDYEPAPHQAERILPLAMNASWDEVSSSEVRRRIQSGKEWRHLVPSALVLMIEDIYAGRNA